MLPYVTIAFACLVGFCSLAVDVGRVMVGKGERQLAADSAARYAITGMSGGYVAARDRAVAAAADNKADGATVVLDPNLDVEFGTWDPYARVFTALAGARRDTATTVR